MLSRTLGRPVGRLLLLAGLAACDAPKPPSVAPPPPAPGTSAFPAPSTTPAPTTPPGQERPGEAHWNAGRERLDQGDLAGALAEFEASLRFGHPPAQAWIRRLADHRARWGPLAEPGWPAGAATETPAGDLAPEPEFCRLDREAKETARTDPAAAEAAFAALTKRFPGQSESRHNRAVCLVALGKTEEALAEAGECTLDLPERHHVLAGLLLKSGKPDEALDEADRAAKAAPAAAVALVRRSEAYEALGRLAEAVHDLGAAIALLPEELALRRRRIDLCRRTGTLDQALADIEVVLTKGEDAALRLERARWFVANGSPPSALPDYDIVTGDDPALRLERSEVRLKAGMIDECCVDLTWLIARAPTADLYARRGDAYASANQASRAHPEYKKALDLDPKCFRALLGRGLLYKNGKDMKNAHADLAKAYELNPDHGWLLFEWGQVLGQLRQYDKAREVLERARPLLPEQEGNIDMLLDRIRRMKK